MSKQPDLRQVIQVLSGSPYFSGLEEGLLAEIAALARRRSCESGETVFWEGDSGQGLYLVEKGWMKVYKLSPAGREQVLHFLGPGEMFNALSVFSGSTTPATVVALEPSTLWVLDQDTMLRLLDERPQLARHVIHDLAKRLHQMLALVEDISLRTVEARLARLLLEHAAGETLNRRRWATQAEMASRLGTVPDVLNRALRKLAEEGLIEFDRHQIKIRDQEGLAAKIDQG